MPCQNVTSSLSWGAKAGRKGSQNKQQALASKCHPSYISKTALIAKAQSSANAAEVMMTPPSAKQSLTV